MNSDINNSASETAADNQATPVIECQGIARCYKDAGREIEVISDINFKIYRGESVAIVGSSGSGKTTLLNMLCGLDHPTSGKVLVDGIDLSSLSETALGKLRNRNLGFVYQFHHLLPEFTALENVAMPILIGGATPEEAQQKAKVLLERVGLGERLEHKPAEMSGGERQRTAIVRALANDPGCLLADEPTGNLDRQTADEVYNLMLELQQGLGTSFIVVTHDLELAGRMDRCLTIKDGKLLAL
ncbi:lipoprotein-releasing ABC transporter ATP-binding protein LolD [Pelagibaculum spongiae]|uniref:Lipoprotein-releasing system ATP-binding protein LolD n=2 Tax=Pelagibaculum spongiae TaxID=2080658 RepID=A0A2V1GWJ8_9GAMM|nr:lipoprotein-releasing ABC transporter ATP-binding protein LolD [Pelagibaculum spongiae]